MTIKKTTPLDILLSGSTSMMFYGEPKVGKTFTAGSFPNQVFIAVPGAEAMTLAQVPSAANMTVLACSEWTDVKEAVEACCSKKLEPGVYETWTLDNLTFAYKMALNWVVSQQRRPVIGENTWPAVNREVSEILDRALLTAHGKNVILVAHNRVQRDENGDPTKIHPDFGENFSRTISGRMNALFHLRMKGKDRELVTKNIAGIVAGSRYDLQGSLLNPTPDSIMAMIDTYKKKVAEQHGR